METPKEAMNERNGKGDEKPWVVCVVKDVSAQWQFSCRGARKCTEEQSAEEQAAEGSMAAAAAAAGSDAVQRSLDRVHDLCWQTIERALLGRGAGDEWVAGRVRRLGSA